MSTDAAIDNDAVAEKLDRAAQLLELQDANPFRVRSYRNAARAVRDLGQPAADVLDQQGVTALTDIRGIGRKLAGAIEEIVDTGRLGLVERLESEVDPEAVLTRVPGVGQTLAARIHEELGVDSLEELERAAHDGRLQRIEGLGEQRIQGMRDALAGMLARSPSRWSRQRRERAEPPVELLLEVDEEYRRKAQAGKLRRIAPRRFNPDGEAWLPILEGVRDGWEFTALFSNTARAHELGKTHDWVVLYYEHDGEEDQCTVVTAGSGRLRGKRAVRGREAECRRYYEQRGEL